MDLMLWFLILLGIKVNGGTFSKMFFFFFGIDDNKWFDPNMENPDTSTGWYSQTLYEIDLETGEMREIEGEGPFWNGRGEYWGHDWLWRDGW